MGDLNLDFSGKENMKNNRLKHRIYARASHFLLHFCAAMVPIRPLQLPDATFCRWHKHATTKLSFLKFKLVCVLCKGVTVRTILLLNAHFKYCPRWGRRVAEGSQPPTSRSFSAPIHFFFVPPFSPFWGLKYQAFLRNFLLSLSLPPFKHRHLLLIPSPPYVPFPSAFNQGWCYSLERLRFTFTPNGRRELVLRDQVSPPIFRLLFIASTQEWVVLCQF